MPEACAGTGQYGCEPSLPDRTGSDHERRQTRSRQIHRREPDGLPGSVDIEDHRRWHRIPGRCEHQQRAWVADYAISRGVNPSSFESRTGKRQRHHGHVRIEKEPMRTTKRATKRTRVLIVDDHPMTRAGLVHLIDHQPDLTVCGEAENAAKALDAVAESEPDLVLADITLPGKSGLELIKDIKAMRPGLPVLVISMHDESLYADRVLRAGARGYITKHEGGEKLMQAIRHVLSGKIYVSEKMSAQILETFSGGQAASARSLIAKLSDREFEVFELLGEGLSARAIAERLHLSTKTVDVHRANIKAKLVIKTASELISYAARWIEHRANKN